MSGRGARLASPRRFAVIGDGRRRPGGDRAAFEEAAEAVMRRSMNGLVPPPDGIPVATGRTGGHSAVPPEKAGP